MVFTAFSWNIAVATLEVLKDNDKTFDVPALGADGQGIVYASSFEIPADVS